MKDGTQKLFVKGRKGKTVAYKTLRLTLYEGGWQVFVGVGGPDLNKNAQGRLQLEAEAAIEAGEHMVRLGKEALENKSVAEGEEGYKEIGGSDGEETVQETPRKVGSIVKGKRKASAKRKARGRRH